jgi:hypothetical protein
MRCYIVTILSRLFHSVEEKAGPYSLSVGVVLSCMGSVPEEYEIHLSVVGFSSLPFFPYKSIANARQRIRVIAYWPLIFTYRPI